jgi:hypothetical protein
MQFSGVHFNILNLFKVSVGKFSAHDMQPAFQTLHKTYPDGTGYNQITNIPLSNRLQCYNSIQSGYEDQIHIRSLSMIITYDSSGHTHHDTGFKGIYVDLYG